MVNPQIIDPMRHRRSGGPRFLKGLRKSGGELENTESIHIVMLTYASSSNAKWYHSAPAAVCSLLLVAVQIFLLVTGASTLLQHTCLPDTLRLLIPRC